MIHTTHSSKLSPLLLLLAVTLFDACNKTNHLEPNTRNIKTGIKKTRTTYDYFSLSEEPNANECYLYGITDNGTSPFYTLINGATDAVIRIGGVAVEEITGIAYENSNNIIAITSPTDPNFPSKIIRLPISNVNNAVVVCSLLTTNLITDIEHDGNGNFYAIDRGMAQGDLPIVSVNINTGAISNLPNNPTIPNNPTFTNSDVMGLAYQYIYDEIYLVVPTGNGQDEEIIKYEIGSQTVTYNPGNYELCADIDANATMGNEMGFHYYYLNGNTHRYIAMSGHYTSPPNDTYFGIPCLVFGGTGLNPYSCLKPTVDFCIGN